MAKCEYARKGEDGFCLNYIGDKVHLENCRKKCAIYKPTDKKIKEYELNKKLEAQIVGIEVPYDPKK